MNKTRHTANANSSFKKEERVRESLKAMNEYNADRALELKKMEKLKALRLAKEAEVAAIAAANPPAPVKKRVQAGSGEKLTLSAGPKPSRTRPRKSRTLSRSSTEEGSMPRPIFPR